MSTLLDDVLVGPNWNENWHMTSAERSVLIRVLERVRPDLSIEIGTFRCGSLRPIAHYSRRVITFDIDANQHRVASAFPTVEFITGDSGILLPQTIDRLNSSDTEDLNFILIDGSHETDGVVNDITACLQYRPKRNPTIILMHDSSNPNVRRGIENAPWDTCPYVHELDYDYCYGALYNRHDVHGQIWGGLAAAIMLPVERNGELKPRANFEYTRLAMLSKSIYNEGA
ncbi:class I SAM-dependent methyltransferase [Methylorubrum aminovorans]